MFAGVTQFGGYINCKLLIKCYINTRNVYFPLYEIIDVTDIIIYIVDFNFCHGLLFT